MGFRVQQKKMWMVVRQAGVTFHHHPEAAAKFASSSKEWRQKETGYGLVNSLKRMEYGAGGEKEKWKSGKQTKGRRIKISWVSEKLLKIFRPLRISGYNFSWACFFFLVVLSISHHIYFLVTSEWEKFLALWESSFFSSPREGWLLKERFLKPQ